MGDASEAVRLYGTDEAVAPPRVLRAGPLSAELEAGNLRYIRYGGAEVLRAVSFVTRDEDWGTYAPAITDLEVTEDGDGFAVTYAARAGEGPAFGYEARIEGRADGRLVFAAEGAAEGAFRTNRTGFVVLHPIAGVAGEPVAITHTDGRVVEGRFPARIDPVQPMMDLRALRHTAPGGLEVTCTMEGDTFEMEDQRNWTDASYKTYVRPLARPWPYTLAGGERLAQSVTVTVAGDAAGAGAGAAVALRLGAEAGRMPALGQGLDPDDAEAALAEAERLAELGIAHLICRHDPRRGHGRPELERQLEVARAMGAEPWLEAVVVEVGGFEAEVAALGAMVADLGAPFGTVLVSPASDLKSTLPGSPWPPAPEAGGLYAAARAAFPGKRIGGGMFSYFTELNRKRPPEAALDLVSFTTSPMVHAGDDRSVMETLEALPAIWLSARAIAGDTAMAVGPSAIGMRDNPYGAAPKDNPRNIRQAMNRNDPRQRGLLGAAWAVGYVARFADAGFEAVALGAPTGAFGAVWSAANFPQPWYDAHGGLFPVYHVIRGLARLRGQPLRALESPAPDRVLGLAVETEAWVANLTPAPLEVAFDPAPEAVALLDAEGFAAAASDPAYLDAWRPHAGGALTLPAFAVARLRLDPS